VPRATRKINGGQYRKTEKSVPSIAIREPRGVTRRTSDVDLETRGFSAKRRPHVSERVFRPPRVPGTPRVLRVAVSKGGGRAKKTHRAIKPSTDGSGRSVAENGVRETRPIRDRAVLRAE
jgi:hypothetical protein